MISTLAIVIFGAILVSVPVVFFIIREILAELCKIKIILKLLRNDSIKTEAEIVNVKLHSGGGRPPCRWYFLQYKFTDRQNDYSGSSHVRVGAGDKNYFNPNPYNNGQQINILYLKNNPAINAVAKTVSYGAIVIDIIIVSVVLLFIACIIMIKPQVSPG